MYFRSQGLITDDQLILGLGIRPEVRSADNVDMEGGAAEDIRDAAGNQLLELPNPEQSGASSPVDTEATHTDPGSDHHDDPQLGLDIYNEDNPSEYDPSP
jgi:hypothetical protein